MPTYRYQIVNVFAEAPLSGNALAVFEHAHDMGDELMQALAQQMHLSETAFILRSDKAAARVRIFTPEREMAFAGHPVLGSAAVIRALLGGSDQMIVETRAALVPLFARGDVWMLQTPRALLRPSEASRTELAQMLTLPLPEVLPHAAFVDNGNEQLMLPLASADAVARCRPRVELLQALAANRQGQPKVYAWHRDGERITARYFTLVNGNLHEDPGTGSAACNLGYWLLHHGQQALKAVIAQGDQISRACRIALDIDADGRVFVGGRVARQGAGEINLPD
ncbi:PhzF family phenazine biosynthesis protein [Chitinivorax sp. PXF-14]|uniref:PhzF family phenazine biosynthesis protein n=1 Tax=Chitinivorax sp. PXF-14 TaxID=3230488 RepID=UPI0034660407